MILLSLTCSQPPARLRPGSNRSDVVNCQCPRRSCLLPLPLTHPNQPHFSPCLSLAWPSAASGCILTRVNSYQCDSVPVGQKQSCSVRWPGLPSQAPHDRGHLLPRLLRMGCPVAMAPKPMQSDVCESHFPGIFAGLLWPLQGRGD